MERKFLLQKILHIMGFISIFLLVNTARTAWSREGYQKVMEQGVLRHLGVPYAHFVTGSGDGLSVDLAKLFARHLGVDYEYIETSWGNAITDLVGKKVQMGTRKPSCGNNIESRGDLIASGFTILPCRKKVLTYSIPTFPSGIWVVARHDCPLHPIAPSGDFEHDIQSTIFLLKGLDVLAIKAGCLIPALNRLQGSGARIRLRPIAKNLNELIPAVLNKEADCTLIDVPDALVGIQKWPGKVKIIGPLSMDQKMGFAFAKSSKKLRDEFNLFFLQCVKGGDYQKLVKKYCPSVFLYYPSFFKELNLLAKGSGARVL